MTGTTATDPTTKEKHTMTEQATTDTTEHDTTQGEATDTTDTESDEQHSDDAEDSDNRGGREAAKYRRRLRDTEGERDGLREQLDGMRRAEVERIAGAKINKPAALWAGGVQLADLLDDQGNIDAGKVDAAVTTACADLGLEQRRRNVVPSEGGNPSMGSSNQQGLAGAAQVIAGR